MQFSHSSQLSTSRLGGGGLKDWKKLELITERLNILQLFENEMSFGWSYRNISNAVPGFVLIKDHIHAAKYAMHNASHSTSV